MIHAKSIAHSRGAFLGAIWLQPNREDQKWKPSCGNGNTTITDVEVWGCFCSFVALVKTLKGRRKASVLVVWATAGSLSFVIECKLGPGVLSLS